MQFLTVEPDVLDALQEQAPQVPHVGGPHLPGVEAWRREHRAIAKRPRSAGSQASDNPAGHVNRRLADDPEEGPPAPLPDPPPGLPPPEAPEEDNMEEEPDQSFDELFSIEALWAIPKDGKEEIDEDDIMESAS